MNRACKDGWLEMDGNGRIRPDEPVTAAEMAHAPAGGVQWPGV